MEETTPPFANPNSPPADALNGMPAPDGMQAPEQGTLFPADDPALQNIDPSLVSDYEGEGSPAPDAGYQPPGEQPPKSEVYDPAPELKLAANNAGINPDEIAMAGDDTTLLHWINQARAAQLQSESQPNQQEAAPAFGLDNLSEDDYGELAPQLKGFSEKVSAELQSRDDKFAKLLDVTEKLAMQIDERDRQDQLAMQAQADSFFDSLKSPAFGVHGKMGAEQAGFRAAIYNAVKADPTTTPANIVQRVQQRTQTLGISQKPPAARPQSRGTGGMRQEAPPPPPAAGSALALIRQTLRDSR